MKAFFSLLALLLLLTPGALSAQDATEPPAASLPLDVISQGALVGVDDMRVQTAYRIALPEAQDVVIRLDSDKVVYGLYCLQTSTASATTESCTGAGGGGDDYPILTYFYFPTDANPATRQFVTLTLVRPLEGIANYTLTPYLVTPTPLALDDVTEVAAPAAAPPQPYQSYALTHDPQRHFTLAAEEPALDGEFLWVAYEPIGEIRDGGAFITETPLSAPKYLDSAGTNDDQDGLQSMVLFYLGGDSFRLFVRSDSDYALRGTQVQTQLLGANEPLTVELSYRQPMQVVRLTSENAGEIRLTVDVTEGTGVFAWFYTIEEAYGDFWNITQPDDTTPEAPLTRVLELPNSVSWRTLVLQLPSSYSREAISVDVSWQPQP